MKKSHKLISLFIFVLTYLIAYVLHIQMDVTSTQNLVTFFSITFGFYMTCLAIIYNSSFSKKLYRELDDLNPHRRKIHTLKKYFASSCYWAIFSILILIINSSLFANPDPTHGIHLYIKIASQYFDLILLINNCVVGITAMNIFFMILFLNTILDGMVEESTQ